MLTLGYKASSEQFGPRELLRYGVLAEELGFRHLVFHFPGPDQGRAMRHFATDVLPPLRKM